MTTAETIIGDAFSEVTNSGDEAPIKADDMQFAIRTLNRMVLSWNFPIGWTVIVNPADLITVTAIAEEALVKNLAAKLAPAYDSIVTTELKGAARGSLASLRRAVITIQPSRLPSRLPTGTGNALTSTFYPPQGAELINEDGASILLEE